MAFNNIPVNGWPQIKGIENIKDIPDMQSDISTLKTTVGDSSSGLVKTVTDQGTAITGLQTVVGDETSGLVKDVNGLILGGNFSTTPVKIGKWDNEDLYRVIAPTGYLGNATETTADLSSVLPANAVCRFICAYVGLGSMLPIPFVLGDEVIGMYYERSTRTVHFKTNKDRSGTQGFLIMLYTEAPPTREEDQEPADDTKTATIKRTKKS